MTDESHDAGTDSFSRRGYLKGAGLAGAAGLAGCLSSLPGAGSEPLEVQHYWTGGDGSDAIQALLDGFREEYPDIEINENPVSGAAGQNLKAVVKKRVLNENPPSTWQAWPGANLVPFTEAGVLEDIEESVWSENGMKDAYLSGPKEAAKPAGNYVTVPINIHRINNLFYNVAVVEELGVDPSSLSKPSDLVGVLAQATDAGYVGMAKQTKSGWSTAHLWEMVLHAEYDVETYRNAIEGNPDESAIRDTLGIVADYKEHYNDDAGSLTWTEANQKFINGEAAFFVQGDWAAGMYRSADGYEFGDQWDHVPFPGSAGTYEFNMDSFPYPTNNPSPDTTKKFLRYCGTVDAQRRFNPKKGSIPPRTDVPKDAFGPFLSRQMDQFADADEHLPSIAHGLAVPPDVKGDIDEAFSGFISHWDTEKTASQIVEALNKV